MRKASEYNIWSKIKQRCQNPLDTAFEHYGGRGISVFPAWSDSFENFFSYVGARPSPSHSIDRYPDQNGNYEPGNVRWATPREQVLNRSATNWVLVDGERVCVKEAAEMLGISRDRVYRMMISGEIEKVRELPSAPKPESFIEKSKPSRPLRFYGAK